MSSRTERWGLIRHRGLLRRVEALEAAQAAADAARDAAVAMLLDRITPPSPAALRGELRGWQHIAADMLHNLDSPTSAIHPTAQIHQFPTPDPS